MFNEVTIDELKPAMRVGRDVLQGGALLVQAGATLSDPVINVLRKRGVVEIIVDSGEAPVELGEPRVGDGTTRIKKHQELGQRATERFLVMCEVLKQQFSGHEEDEIMRELLMAAHRFWRARIASEFAHAR